MEAVMSLNIAALSVECPHQAFASSVMKSVFVSSPSSMKEMKMDQCVCQIVLSSPFRSRKFLRSQTFNKCSSRVHTVKRSCSAKFDGSFAEQHIEGLAQSFGLPENEENEEEDLSTKGSCTKSETNSSTNKDAVHMFSENSFLQPQTELLEPSKLGIRPEPPVWLERESVMWVRIEQKAKSFDLPLSLRMIKKKHQRLKGLKVLGQSAYSSVDKAFSSMVFIIVELQSSALQIREALCNEDLEMIIAKVQRDMHSSFAWLFQQVFSRTPALMIYVMILLANFSVYSTSHNVVIAQASVLESLCEITADMPSKNHSQVYYSLMASKTFSENCTDGREANLLAEGIDGEDGNSICSSKSMQYPSLSPEEVFQVGHQELTSEAEVSLWNSMLDEATKMQAGENNVVIDPDVLQRFVSPISVEVEPDYYIEYLRTDVLYQTGLSREPSNPLLLCNYAQFLHLVAHDYDRAEECFKHAIQLEPPDAETLSRYADFLWRVRKDLGGAEERYQQALSVEPDNSYHASKYASFLWSTGGEETCFPLNASNNNSSRSNLL